MEKTIIREKIDKILSQINIDTEKYIELTKKIYIFTIDIELNSKRQDIEDFETYFEEILYVEKIAIYILTKSISIYSNGIDNKYKEQGLSIAAIIFEKLALIIESLDTQEVETIRLKEKIFKYYLKSSICYSLSNNIPNSVLTANLSQKYINNDDIFDKKTKNIYIFLCELLNRNFEYIDGPKILIEIIRKINNFFINGDNNEINDAIEKVHNLKSKVLNENYDSNFFIVFKYAELIIIKIKNNSVWAILKNKIPDEFIKQLIRSTHPIRELWENQKNILEDNNSFLNNTNVKRSIINLPTSGGKTLIAEIAIQNQLETYPDKICLFLVPSNALVNEVYKKLSKRFKNLGFSVGQIKSGIEFDKNDETVLKENIIVCTPEKFDAIVRNDINTDILKKISFVIFDEFHKINEIDFKNKKLGRGWIIESLIWFLISHHEYKNIHIMLLSAILDNGDFIAEWLEDENIKPVFLKNDWKPTLAIKGIIKEEYGRWTQVPIEDELKKQGRIGIQNNIVIDYKERNKIILKKQIKYHFTENKKLAPESKRAKMDYILDVINYLEKIGPNLLFFNEKRECEDFIEKYNTPTQKVLEVELEYLINYIIKRLGDSHLLVRSLKKGIVYHHGSLPLDIREALESYFAKGKLNTIVSTTTLAEGVNFPINNFIYSGKRYKAQREIESGNFKNLAGRAGRAYQNTFGQVLFIKNDYLDDNSLDEYDIKENYIHGSLNSVVDLYSLDAETQLNDIFEMSFFKSILLFYNTISDDENEIENFLDKTLSFKNLAEEKKNYIVKYSKYAYNEYTKIPIEIRKFIQTAGISLKTFNELEKIVDEIISGIKFNFHSISTFREILKVEIFDKIINLNEFKYFKVKKSKASKAREIKINSYEFFIDWVDNKLTLSSLKEKFFRDVDEDYRDVGINDYIKNNIEYKLAWAFGALTKIIIKKHPEFGSEFIQNMGKYSKYGINKKIELDLVNIGFSSRELIISFGDYIAKNINYKSIQELEEQLISKFDTFNMKDMFKDITEYEIKQYINITNNLRKFEVAKNIFETNLVGIYFNLDKNNKKEYILEHLDGNSIFLRHEKENYYDENAVVVYFEDEKIGYIPRKINEQILFYLNLKYDYKIELKEIIRKKDITYINLSIEFLN